MRFLKTSPAARGFPPTPGWARVWSGPLEAEAGSRELGGRRQERSACLTTGLPGYGQACCLRVVVLQHQKVSKKGPNLNAVFARVFIFDARGWIFEGFQQVLRSPACFLQGLAPPVVRWEVSYKGKSFQKKLEFWSGPKFRKMSQMTWGGPPRTPKNISKFGPGPKFGPMFWALYLITGPGPVL